MKNLKLKYCLQFVNKIPGAIDFAFVAANKDEIFVTSINQVISFGLENGNIKLLNEIEGIIGCEYLGLKSQICVATSKGEVLMIDPFTKIITEGSFCDCGIDAMSWSPNQEVVVFITRTHNVVVMTSNYEPISEHKLSEIGESSIGGFINIGWGKKETQYHGSEGKPKMHSEMNEFKEIEENNELSKRIHLSWRYDSAFFVVSYFCKETGRRFKVFDNEGKLHFTSEIVQKLSPPIAWRPSGNWIAIPHQLPNKSTVGLFEKNGLRHHEIIMPFSFDNEMILNLKWNIDSEILAIQTNKNILYLYTINNYHWYLKQVLKFGFDDRLKITVFKWDDRIGNEKTVHIFLSNGTYIAYDWRFFINKLDKTGFVGVIDGKNLLITDFGKSAIPPPMFGHKIETESNIIACEFRSRFPLGTKLFIHDDEDNLHIYVTQTNEIESFQKEKTLKFVRNSDLFSFPIDFHHILWFDFQHIIATRTVGNISEIILFELAQLEIATINSFKCDYLITDLIIGSERSGQIFVKANNGIIYLFSVDMLSNQIRFVRKHCHLDNCDELQFCENALDGSPNLISLRNKGGLYHNSVCLATGVTSFCIVDDYYLAYTQISSLKFLGLNNFEEINERKIEQGAQIITIMTNDSRIVLQIPRGNLEIIYSRVLLLKKISKLLKKDQYCLAIKIMRKQRINLNLLCDHNIAKFVKIIPRFLQEIENCNWLNLFIADLQNEDFTMTMYKDYYSGIKRNYPDTFKIEGKTMYICRKMCDEMEKNFENRFELTLLTAYVKMNQLDKALDIVWKYKQQENFKIEKSAHSSEEMLKYLMYLVDVNHLYNVALGTYDLSLVLFVANKSQKDPKEYIPFINKLKSYENNYRMFFIDNHLKRYPSALEHLAKCEETKFNEALEFIKKHEMYQKGLQVYKSLPSCYQEICLCFADYLRANGKLENASIMYERGGNLSQALNSARHILDWQRTLMLAKKAKMDLRSVALSLISPLQENDKHDDAYNLAITYTSDLPEALNILIKGKLFLKALFEMRMRSQNENFLLLDTNIRSAILDYSNQLQENIIRDKQLYTNHKKRLIVVRENNANQKVQNDHYIDTNNLDENDDASSLKSSEFSSYTRSTGKTFRSSKNRRKHERKIFSLKEGSPFEDIALIDTLYNQATKAFSQQTQIHDICKALLEIQKDEDAKNLQEYFKDLLRIIQESLNDIWVPEMLTTKHVVSNFDYFQLQIEHRYAMLDPLKRVKPTVKIIKWEHEILHDK